MKKKLLSGILSAILLISVSAPINASADGADYKNIYYDFMVDNLITRGKSGGWTDAILADLNLDGTPELIIYDSGASASAGFNICQIVDGKVQLRYGFALRDDENFNKDYFNWDMSRLHFQGYPPNESNENTFSLRKNKYTGELMYTHSSHAAADDFYDNALLCFSKESMFNASEKVSCYVKYDTDKDYGYYFDTYDILTAEYAIDGNAVSEWEYNSAYNEFLDTWQDTGYEFTWLTCGRATERDIRIFIASYIPEKSALGMIDNSAVDNDALLKEFAKDGFSLMLEQPSHNLDGTLFLLADITGDGRNELVAKAGYLEIYTVENGTVKMIYQNTNGHSGSSSDLHYYNNTYSVLYASFSQPTNLKCLYQYINGQMEKVHESYREWIDCDPWKYKIDGEYTDEATYNDFDQNLMEGHIVPDEDYMTLDELMAYQSEPAAQTPAAEQEPTYGMVSAYPIKSQVFENETYMYLRLINNSGERIKNKRILLAITTITNEKTKEQKEVVEGYLEKEDIFEPYEEKVQTASLWFGGERISASYGATYTQLNDTLAENYVHDRDSLENGHLLVVEFYGEEDYENFMRNMMENEITDSSTEEKIERNAQWLKDLKAGKFS